MKIELIFDKNDTIEYKRKRLFQEAFNFIGNYPELTETEIFLIVYNRLLGLKLNGFKCWIEFE